MQEVHESPGDGGPLEESFHYRHANNVVWLADEVLFLIREDQIVGPPILLRVMLESVFNLAASVSIENFHARKTVWELRDMLRRLRNLGLESAMGGNRGDVVALIDRIEKQYALEVNEPSWPVSRIALEAGVTAFLRKEYFILSGHIHSSSATLLSRDSGTYSGLIHQTLITSLVLSAGFSAQLLETKDPQVYIDRATALGHQQQELIRSGAFDDGNDL